VCEIIQYVKGRCCCGKIDLAPENEDVIHNDTVHQLLGPEGNFCGPTYLHTIKNLESRVREIEEAVKDWHKVADQRSAEIIRLEAERDRLKEELEFLKEDIQAENDELSLKAFNKLKQHLQLECDRIAQAYRIEFESEKELRSRHAALVEAAENVTGWVWFEILRYAECDSSEIQADIDKLKAALAELKGG
jgi:chromosome segregation ATPase